MLVESVNFLLHFMHQDCILCIMKRMLVTRAQLDAINAINIGYRTLITRIARELRVPGDRIPPEKWTQEHRDAADHLFGQFSHDEVATWDKWVNEGFPRLDVKQSIEEYFAGLGVGIPDAEAVDNLPARVDRRPALRNTQAVLCGGRPVLGKGRHQAGRGPAPGMTHTSTITAA